MCASSEKVRGDSAPTAEARAAAKGQQPAGLVSRGPGRYQTEVLERFAAHGPKALFSPSRAARYKAKAGPGGRRSNRHQTGPNKAGGVRPRPSPVLRG